MGKVDEPIPKREYEQTFKLVTSTLRDAGVPHACMGSLALWALGGPEPNHQQDIDFAICEADADLAREVLAGIGMTVEQPPEDWLFKAWSGAVNAPGSALVDLIYRPSGLVITRDRLRACEVRSVLAMSVPVLAATDLLVTKIHSLTEQCADFSSTLQFARSLREQVDRRDLEHRIADTPFGSAFLSLVDGLGISPRPEQEQPAGRGGRRPSASNGRDLAIVPEPEASMLARVSRSIAEDERSSTLDIEVSKGADGSLVLRGEAANEHHRQELLEVVRDVVPGLTIDDRVEVRNYEHASDVEEIG